MSRMNRLGRAKAYAKRKEITGPSGGIRERPRTVQLPGGIALSAMPFVITSYTDEGAPRTFEILPHGQDPSGEHGCVLYAHEEWIRGANPKHAKPDDEKPLVMTIPPREMMSTTMASRHGFDAQCVTGGSVLAEGEIVDDGE